MGDFDYGITQISAWFQHSVAAIGFVMAVASVIAIFQFASRQSDERLLNEVELQSVIVYDMTDGFVRAYSLYEVKYAKGQNAFTVIAG